MKKYVLIAGKVRSRNDGQLHFISSKRLCELYDLDSEECVFAHEDRPETFQGYKGLIFLYPRSSGNYSLKKDL